MLGWIWRVVVGRFKECEHEWQEFYKERFDWQGIAMPQTCYHLRCKKCGDVKFQKG